MTLLAGDAGAPERSRSNRRVVISRRTVSWGRGPAGADGPRDASVHATVPVHQTSDEEREEMAVAQPAMPLPRGTGYSERGRFRFPKPPHLADYLSGWLLGRQGLPAIPGQLHDVVNLRNIPRLSQIEDQASIKVKSLYARLQSEVHAPRVEYAQLQPQVDDVRRRIEGARLEVQRLEAQPAVNARRQGEARLSDDLVARRRKTEHSRALDAARKTLGEARGEHLVLQKRLSAIEADVRNRVDSAEAAAHETLRNASQRISVFFRGVLRSHPFPRELSRHVHEYEIKRPDWLDQSIASWLSRPDQGNNQ